MAKVRYCSNRGVLRLGLPAPGGTLLSKYICLGWGVNSKVRPQCLYIEADKCRERPWAEICSWGLGSQVETITVRQYRDGEGKDGLINGRQNLSRRVCTCLCSGATRTTWEFESLQNAHSDVVFSSATGRLVHEN